MTDAQRREKARLYTDASGVVDHGFLRAPDGTFTTFDVPGSKIVRVLIEGTGPTGTNPAGTITGSYQDAKHKRVFHGFLRSP